MPVLARPSVSSMSLLGMGPGYGSVSPGTWLAWIEQRPTERGCLSEREMVGKKGEQNSVWYPAEKQQRGEAGMGQQRYPGI